MCDDYQEKFEDTIGMIRIRK